MNFYSTSCTCRITVWALLLAATGMVQAQTATVQGTVTDSETGQPLAMANVQMVGTTIGAAADGEGQYVVTNLAPGEYTIRVTHAGYRSYEADLQIEAGGTLVHDVALVAGVDLDPIQITAGRRQEKVLDAPASISVVTASELESDVVAPSTIRALRNLTAVDIAQTGVDRHEVVLRGFNNVFSGAAHVLTDYRRAASPSIGVNLHSIMPNLAIDVDRIEVVRGPGSALYGAGVDSGVIHYISKSAFDYPGATVSISGGQQSMFNFQGRLATTLGSRVGVKVTGSYGTAQDFELQGCDPAILEAQMFSQCPDPDDAVQIFVDGIRDTDFRKSGIAGNVDVRLGPSTTLSFNAGTSAASGTVLSGVGTLQADGYRYTFGQVRFSSGRFFMQGYVNSNDSGDSRVYGGDPVVEYSEEFSAQAQYDLQFGSRQSLILGVDLDLIRPDTRYTVLGRNEDSDEIDEYGAYVQSSTEISEKLDLVLALRGDYSNVVDKLQLSPRVGLVVKPNPTSSFRATFNRSFSSPTATTYYLDLVAATLPGNIKVRGRGAANAFTYERNADFLAYGAPTDLVASSLLPGAEGAPVPVGISTETVYALMYSGLVAIPNEVLAQMLADAGLNVPVALIGLLKDGLSPANTVVQGFSPGVLGSLNLSTFSVESGPNDLTDTEPIQQTTSQTFEVGYKGIIGDKVLLAVDAYHASRSNFAGALQTHTPFVLVPGLTQDLVRDIAAGIAANTSLAGALGLFNLTPEQAAQLLVDVAGSALPSASTPIAIVQPRENNPGIGEVPELMLTYPNFGSIKFYGVDLALQVAASRSLTLFGNLSWVSDDYFDHTEVNEESEELSVALNAPALKIKLGGQYRHASGLSVNLSGRYIDGYPVNSGPYEGDVDSYFVMDLGLGYTFANTGLRADLGVNNLFNSDHREFVGAPKLGRLANARMTYTTDWGN